MLASALLAAPAWANQATGLRDKLERQLGGAGGSGDAMDARPGGAPAAKPAKSYAATRIYRFKAERKAAFGEWPAMALVMEDMLTGKSETVYVPNAEPTKFTPIAAVADAMKEIKPGD